MGKQATYSTTMQYKTELCQIHASWWNAIINDYLNPPFLTRVKNYWRGLQIKASHMNTLQLIIWATT